MTRLDAHTLDTLDWPSLLTALSEQARTPLGARAALALAALDHGGILAALDGVDEVLRLRQEGSELPLDGIDDTAQLGVRAAKGEVLMGEELLAAGRCLAGLDRLARALARQAELAPSLAGVALQIEVDPDLGPELVASFEADASLSERAFPQLRTLRRQIADLHLTVRSTLQDLLQDDGLADVLQDRFVTTRGDRYVLPIKAHAKRWDLGIVHGSSGSGQTVFVEPHQVVQLNNRLRLAEAELHAEEHRILVQLSRSLGSQREPMARGLIAATELDLAVARAGLAQAWQASRPTVGEQGVVRLLAARHPGLLLRGVEVVPNDLGVGEPAPALVLTGPNTGGKTVALKTLGLCALLVRIGCYVPAATGSRVDRFEQVLADIGDQQAVSEDLSSFSGHVAHLAEMLRRAGPHSLLLIDEIATGTDPSQGAALAQAVLEALLDRGARLVLTTHYPALKAIGDPRFALAGMASREGAPTYHVLHGRIAHSHALEIAGQLGLDAALITRARALMDSSELRLADALSAVESERNSLIDSQQALDHGLAEMDLRDQALRRKEQRLAQRIAALDADAATAFRAQLAKAERAVSAVVADLQRAPGHGSVQVARDSLGALASLAPAPQAPKRAPAQVVVGDRVRVLALGQVGEVEAISGRKITVRTRSITLRVGRDEVERLAASGAPKRRAAPPPLPPSRLALPDAVRTPANTLDLRGQRAEEAEAAIERFFDRALMSHHDVVFLLHGHGTGALKAAVRGDWLRASAYVRDFGPASAEQGGDAFTIALLGGVS